ncbi:MAG TPA: MetS family NSS transporter small subunit [Thermoplasmatales archaeon]|nr:MetS family NSS transporter small subunit [Thermoplasmatales archaeon]
MSLSAIIMLIFGSTVLYGGLLYFIYRAFKAGK